MAESSRSSGNYAGKFSRSTRSQDMGRVRDLPLEFSQQSMYKDWDKEASTHSLHGGLYYTPESFGTTGRYTAFARLADEKERASLRLASRTPKVIFYTRTRSLTHTQI